MNDEPEKTAKNEPTFAGQVGAKAARKLKTRKSTQGVWFGLGMMGLIGWSVAGAALLGAAPWVWVGVPALLGAALGIWLDKPHPGKHAWPLALLVAGLVIGFLNAWHWVAKEDKAMREE